ncbi:MAG: hypothetical protein CVV27_15930 [Candidatus Melainabacteria bacterium HGW-Melainabacteria-1]|nr:MAG: hypothetical protein CVV27_15930 [Candidatus Melainabacteria bacterium HGW-Melainabacteria-1]
MKFTCFLATALLLFQLGQPAIAGESWKSFTSFELGLMFLDPQGMVGSADEQLDKLFAQTDEIMRDMPDGTLSAAKPVSDSVNNMSQQILGVAKGHGDELHPYLKPYQLLDKQPLRYEQIDLPAKIELRSLVARSNALLKRIHRISETVKFSDALLPQLQSDLGKLNPEDAMHKASLGIVAVSLANLNLSASQAASQARSDLEPLQQQVENQLRKTQGQVQANPMSAFGLGEDIQVLSSLTATLGRASGALGDAGKKMPGILSSLQGILGQLKA